MFSWLKRIFKRSKPQHEQLQDIKVPVMIQRVVAFEQQGKKEMCIELRNMIKEYERAAKAEAYRVWSANAKELDRLYKAAANTGLKVAA
jgi:hypothetical protein